MDARTIHVRHTILSVATTQGLVCTTHQRSVLYTLLFGCAHYTFMMVCYAHHKRCAYRDIGSTPYLVCCTHFSFYSVSLLWTQYGILEDFFVIMWLTNLQ